jgi:hypothetical protein
MSVESSMLPQHQHCDEAANSSSTATRDRLIVPRSAWRAGRVSVGAEHTAVARLRGQSRTAPAAQVDVLAPSVGIRSARVRAYLGQVSAATDSTTTPAS